MRGTRFQYLVQLLQYAVNIFQHFIVPEPLDFESCFFKPQGATDIACAIRMLPAIHLDNQHRVVADKVGDKVADRYLTPEFPIFKTPVA